MLLKFYKPANERVSHVINLEILFFKSLELLAIIFFVISWIEIDFC